MNNDDYFSACQSIADRLSRVEGLRAVTAEQAATQRTAPAGATAVVCFGKDVVVEALGGEAFVSEQDYRVVLMCRGAVSSSAVDGMLVSQVIRALHEFRPSPDASSNLKYSGTDSDFEDNARYYTITFSYRKLTHLAH